MKLKSVSNLTEIIKKYRKNGDAVEIEDTVKPSNDDEMDLSEINLLDLIPREKLQSIQDSLANASGLATIIADLDGNPITDPSNFNPVCVLVQKTSEGKERCDLSDKERRDMAREIDRPTFHKCLSCGFVDASVPIYVGQRHLADWLIGQCNALGVEREWLREYAVQIGADPDEMAAAFDSVPDITMEKFEDFLDLLQILAGQISDLCLSNLKMKYDSESHRKIVNRLTKDKNLIMHFMEVSPVSILLFDATGKIRFANEHAVKLFDLTWDEMSGNFYNSPGVKVTDLEGNPFPVEKLPFIQVMNSGKSVYNIEHVLHMSNQRRLVISTHASPLYNEKRQFDGIVAIIEDITERKLTENALRESEQRYRNIVDALPIGMHVYHLDVNDLLIFDGTNSAADRILGTEFQQHVGKTIEEIFPLLSKTNVMEKFKAAAANGEIWESEIFVDEDEEFPGAYRITAFQTTPGNMAVIFSDISDDKKFEEILIRSEKSYHELFENVLEGFGIVDKNDELMYVNPAFAKAFDFNSPMDMIGEKLTKYIAEDDFEEILHDRNRKRQVSNSAYEIEIVTTKNVRKHILSSISPRFDEGRNYIGAFCTLLDITEKKQLEELASRAQRLETAGQIAGQVAHDFNNLLGPLIAYPDIIREELPEGHPVLEFIDDIEMASKAIAEINQELLTLGRRGHYTTEVLNLNDAVNKCLKQIGSTPDSLQVDLNLGEGLFNSIGSAIQINRVLLNLITNARDAMGDEGRLYIRTENYYVEQYQGKFTLIPAGEYVKLTVSDTGKGIKEENLTRIFDPFFSTKVTSKRRGTGLGLSVVHAVVEDHKGFIDWDSIEGEGTAFYVYLPPTRERIQESKKIEVVGGSENILVVDDDGFQQQLINILLTRLGYIVTVVESGEQALDIFQEQTFDLVILDMIMPGGMNGAETLAEILKINPNQRSLILSGYAETEQVKKAMALGAGEFVRKPISQHILALVVRKELDRVVETV